MYVFFFLSFEKQTKNGPKLSKQAEKYQFNSLSNNLIEIVFTKLHVNSRVQQKVIAVKVLKVK